MVFSANVGDIFFLLYIHFGVCNIVYQYHGMFTPIYRFYSATLFQGLNMYFEFLLSFVYVTISQ